MSSEWTIKCINACEGWLKDFVIIVAYTGMRPIEVARLTWSDDIDFSKGTIRAVTFKGIGSETVREIPMPSEIMLLLKKRRLQVSGKLVFPDSNGGVKKTDNIDQSLRDVTKSLGLSGYTLYGMRHSFATRSLESGVDLNSLRMLMGHTNLNTTQVYLRYTQDHLRSAIEQVSSGRNLVCNQTATKNTN